MLRDYVYSSRITSVGWYKNVLEVEFPDGKIYHYFDVSYDEFRTFKSLPSLGHALSILEKSHKYAPVN